MRRRPGVPVAFGSGDQPCGAIGVGAVAGAIVSLAIGTSGVALAPQDAPWRAGDDAWTHTFCHALPDRWYRMGVSLCAGGSLRWLQETIGTGEYVRTLIGEAAAVRPRAGPHFLPYLSGERTPIGSADARGSFVGLGLEHGRDALVRAVLEGVAYALRDCLDAVSVEEPAAPSEARVSGGGASSELWLRILASVLGAR